LFHEQYKYQEDREAIEIMIEELDRINDIITAFLTISQKNHHRTKLMSLNECIGGVLQLIVADAVQNDVFLDTQLEPTPDIMIDKGEIKQLVLNLTRNAIQAMPSGGTLTVHTFEDVNGVNLVVRDEGGGIPPEIFDKIGTPFLTTKDNGTGLGLGVCYSIAERHNARITVDTSSEGTSFHVTFPLSRGRGC
jgi:signal transduction histidine kinase